MYCPKCGLLIEMEGASFCKRCGANLRLYSNQTNTHMEREPHQKPKEEATFSSGIRITLLVLAIAYLVFSVLTKILWHDFLFAILFMVPGILMIVGVLLSQKYRPILLSVPLILEVILSLGSLIYNIFLLATHSSLSISQMVSAYFIEGMNILLSIVVTVFVFFTFQTKSSGLKITSIIMVAIHRLFLIVTQIGVIINSALFADSSMLGIAVGRSVYILCLICAAAYWIICLLCIKSNEKASSYQASAPMRYVSPANTPIRNIPPANTPMRNVQQATTPMGYNQPVSTSMGFMDLNEFIIDEKISAFQFENSYKIYDMNGTIIGAVQQAQVSGGAKAARVLVGKSAKTLQKFHLDLLSADGRKLGSIRRDGGAMASIFIEDASGYPIVEAKLRFGALKDMNDNIICKFGMAGLAKYTIKDPNGNILATISHKWNGAKSLFTTADKYHVSVTPGLNGAMKQIVYSLAVALDMFTGDR